VYERAKTVHVLDRRATVIGQTELMCKVNCDLILWTSGPRRFGYEELFLLSYEAVRSGESQQLFRKNISPPCSESEKAKQETNIKGTANNLSKMLTGRTCVKRSQ
jgi:hypothetical protein